jgi:hypothetical protein
MVFNGCQEFIKVHLVFLDTQMVSYGLLHIVLVYARPASAGTVVDDLLVFSACAVAMGSQC